MLLRRVIQHFRKQEWTAIAIDFVIVVVGVFIGIQVANWNASLQERKAEARIIQRLDQEVAALIDARAEKIGFNAFVRDGIESSLLVLYEAEAQKDLSATDCLAIAVSHVYSAPPDDLPVIEEILSTGRIDIIRHAGIKRALSNFIRSRDQGRTTLSAVRAHINQLPVTYPDLIATNIIVNEATSTMDPQPQCQTSAMRLDQGFLNQLISNRQKFLTYFESLFIAVDLELNRLQSEIENELGPHTYQATTEQPAVS